jgi:hypothetical protein
MPSMQIYKLAKGLTTSPHYSLPSDACPAAGISTPCPRLRRPDPPRRWAWGAV